MATALPAVSVGTLLCGLGGVADVGATECRGFAICTVAVISSVFAVALTWFAVVW